MSPIETPNPKFTVAQPPPGFFHGPPPRSGSPPPASNSTELLHHLAHVSRAKLDNLFRSRKDSGLLKHVLIQNLSRSYEDLVPDLVLEEREGGYSEVVVQNRTAEEMWLDACLQDLDDDDEGQDGIPMYIPAERYDRHYYYGPEEDDIVMTSSTPSLSPDMPHIDDSDLVPDPQQFAFDWDDEESGLTPPSLMDLESHDQPQYFDLVKDDQPPIFTKQRLVAQENLAAFDKMRFLEARDRGMEEWTDVSRWVYYE